MCFCMCVCVCLSVCVLWPSHLNPEKAGVCVCVCVCVCVVVPARPLQCQSRGPHGPSAAPRPESSVVLWTRAGAVQKDAPMPASYYGKKHRGLHPSFPFSSAELDQMSKRISTRRGGK